MGRKTRKNMRNKTMIIMQNSENYRKHVGLFILLESNNLSRIGFYNGRIKGKQIILV